MGYVGDDERDDERPDWCTCNCDVSKHYYKYYPATFTCPQDADFGCRGCDDCCNEDLRQCECCGKWVDMDDTEMMPPTKEGGKVWLYCKPCAAEEKGE